MLCLAHISFAVRSRTLLLAFFNAPPSEELYIGFETLLVGILRNELLPLEVVVCYNCK